MLKLLPLTSRRSVNLLLFSLVVLLLLCTCWLFGLVWALILCACHGLSYCTCCYVCYRPEATKWREMLAEWYDHLFMWAFNYSHKQVQASQSSAPTPEPVSSPSHSIGQRKSRTESSTSKEGLVGCTRPPQPVAEQESGVTDEQSGEADVKPSLKCHKEAQKIIQLLMRDFIRSWYSNMTSDSEFLEDVQKVLEHVALEINIRVQQMDAEKVAVDLVELILPYLEVLNKAGSRSFNGGLELFDVINDKCLKEFEANPKVAHPALRSPASERRHYRQALDAILQKAFPVEYARCDVASMFVRELLLKNLIEPIFDLLCEPAFLYECIPMILAKASPEKVSQQLQEIVRENEELDHVLNRGRLIINIMGAHGRNSRRFHSNSGHFGQSAQYSRPSQALLRTSRKNRDFSRPQSFASFSGLQKTSSGIYESGSWHTQSTNIPPSPLLQSKSEDTEHEVTYPPLVPSLRTSPIRTRRDQDQVGRWVSSGKGSCDDSWDDFYEVDEADSNMELQGEEMEDGAGEENSFEVVGGEFAVVQLAPIYIERHVRVVPESGSQHVAYIFKFPKWMLTDGDLIDLGVLDSDTHLEGIKRFSEFSKFHDALLSSPLGNHVKGLNLPQKRNFSNFISKLPFTSSEPDATVLIERKQGLEKYLQSVSSVEEILISDLFKTFLKSAVQDLKDSNIVNPTRKKKQHRKTFLGRVKPEEALMAEPVPERQFDCVLSSYLNTHLPLPCNSLNSIHGIKKQRRNTGSKSVPLVRHTKHAPQGRASRSFTVAGSVDEEDTLRKFESEMTKKPHRNPSLSSLGRDQAVHLPRSSPTSSLSSSQSMEFAHHKLPPLTDSVHHTSHYEHSSTEVPNKEVNSGIVDTAMEAIHDENVSGQAMRLPDVVGSILPSHRYYDDAHLRNNEDDEDEEKHTIGSVSSSLKYSSIMGFPDSRPSSASPPPDTPHTRPPLSPPPPSSPVPPTPPLSSRHVHPRHSQVFSHKEVNSFERKQVLSEGTDGSAPARKKAYPSKRARTERSNLPVWQSGLKMVLYRIMAFIHWSVSWMVFIIHRGMEPLSKSDSLSLLKEQQHKAPFTNALFCLGSEASKRHCTRLWACERDTQLALLVLSGAGLERFLWRELRMVVYDDTNWMRSLYVLRHTLWPGGKFIKSSNRKFTDSEVDALKRKAANSFKKFLPNFFPYIVGIPDYDEAVVHCLDCLGNPRINRHFFLSVVDVLMVKLVPQLADSHYQKQLRLLRTTQPPSTHLEEEYDIIS